MLLPLSDLVWVVFVRGVVIGFLGGFVLILLFFWTGGRHSRLTWANPIEFLYFLAGLMIGIALIGAIVFLGLNTMHSRRTIDQSKSGSGTS